MFPTWPAKSEQQRVKRGTSPRPPEGGLAYSHLVRTLSVLIQQLPGCVKEITDFCSVSEYFLLVFSKITS